MQGAVSGGGNFTVYALKEGYTTRSLTAVNGDANHNRFLVGTCSLKQKNEIYLLNFNELDNKIVLEGLFDHEEEIYAISSSPYNANQFITSYATEKGGYGASMFDLGVLTEDLVKPEEEEEEGKTKLECNDTSENTKLKKIFDFGVMESPIHSILWDDASVLKTFGRDQPEEIVLCDSEAMRIFDVNTGKERDCLRVLKRSGYEDEELIKATRMSLDPRIIGNVISNHIVCWDTREFSSKPAYKIENAHLAPICDIDFNPNKPYSCCTGGEDLNVRFWDIRKGNNFLLNFEEDSHWVLNVKYNRYHDQLVLTSSSSTYASLWRAASCSSINTPLTKNSSATQDSKEKDTIIQTYEHEDSIHGIEWSASDAWIFASVSYNGTFYINNVPSEEKWIVLWD